MIDMMIDVFQQNWNCVRHGKGKRIGPSKTKPYSITSQLVNNIACDFFPTILACYCHHPKPCYNPSIHEVGKIGISFDPH